MHNGERGCLRKKEIGNREECYPTGGIEGGQVGPKKTRTKDQRHGLSIVQK